MTRLLLTIGLALLLAVPREASAQGRGRPKLAQPRSQTSAPVTRPGAGGPDAASPASAFRQFGSWLDDASVPAAGEARAGIGVGYWRTFDGNQIDVPIFDVGYGLMNRVQLAATVPFYRANYDVGTVSGLDDVYLSTKVALIDPHAGGHGAGLAVTPVVEILSGGLSDGRRVHWALPVSMEVRAGRLRIYGAGGYFSRGAVFTGGALEWMIAGGTVISGGLTQSLDLHPDLPGDAPGSGRRRIDVTGGLAQSLTDTVAAYVAVSRSLTSVAEGGASLGLSGGISWRFAAASSVP